MWSSVLQGIVGIMCDSYASHVVRDTALEE